MKALVYMGERSLEVQDMPAPEGAFVVRVRGCDICGTDLKTYLHGHPNFTPPCILGHEFIGNVERAPLESGYKPGDAVVVAPYGECGKCELCLRGAGELCRINTMFHPARSASWWKSRWISRGRRYQVGHAGRRVYAVEPLAACSPQWTKCALPPRATCSSRAAAPWACSLR